MLKATHKTDSQRFNLNSKMKSGTKTRRKATHIVRTMRCGYCWRVFHGRVSLYNKHVRNHEKKYAKHWSKKDGDKTDAVTQIDNGIESVQDKLGLDDGESRQSGLQRARERLYVYIVHAPLKPACECNKENQAARMPCDCDYTFNRMVYSSVAQMHRSLRDGVGYYCRQCKKKVLPPRDSYAGVVTAPLPPAAVCGKCKDSFSAQHDLEVHQQVCFGFKRVGRRFECLQCSARRDQRRDMILHATIIHPAKDNDSSHVTQNVCPVCHQRYLTSENLKAHLQSHPEYAKKDYACIVCGLQCSDAGKLRKHAKIHKEKKVVIVSNQLFSKKKVRRMPSQSIGRAPIKKRRCADKDYAPGLSEDDCKNPLPKIKLSKSAKSAEATNSSGVALRQRKPLRPIVYDDEETESDTSKEKHRSAKQTKPMYSCDTCKKVFSSRNYLKKHESTHKQFPCEKCEKSFSSQVLLKMHEKIHIADNKHACKYCSKVFDYVSDHQIHESLHEEYDGLELGAHRYKCQYCRKGLQNKTDLKLHEALHEATGRYDFPCDHCDKVFRHRLEMEQHRKNHFRDKLPKPTKCEECDETFLWRKQLRDHRETHVQSEKPFLCVYCRTRFRTQEELTAHEPIHTKGKRHQCPICNRRFKEKYALRDHMFTHTGEKPFSCKYCQKRFRQSGQLRTHERVHTREESFVCEICNRGFIFSSSLQVHRRTHFKGVPPEEVEKLIKTPIVARGAKKRPPRKGTMASSKKSSAELQSQQLALSSHQNQVILPETSLSQNVRPPPMPIQLTIQSNDQMHQSLTESAASHIHHRLVAEEQQQHQHHTVHQSNATDSQSWESMHNRYLNNPAHQTWQPPSNWQGLPGTSGSTQPTQNPVSWEMPPPPTQPPGDIGAGPPPAHQGHTSASIITSALYGIVQRDGEGRVYEQ